ncbi:MAG: DUF2764 family protein [Bacteroidales bacterium]|nr:DUF2764 family protein [Bacteroidales bacterium]
MYKRNYYCLVAGLPDIIIDEKKQGESSSEFKNELTEQLYESDYKLAELLYLNYDNKNILNLLLKQNKQFINLGKYLEEELEEQIKEPTYIVDYIKQFIINCKEETSDKSDLSRENELQSLFYDHILLEKNDFLKHWFKFDRDIKNILTAVNCHRYAYDIEKHLIPTKHENEVYEILIKGSPKPDILADEVPYIDKILQIAESEMDKSEKEKALDNIKWTFLDEYTFFNYFTIEKILSYIIKLDIAERWINLDNETGKKLFEKLINEIKMTYKFPEEFSVKK